MDGAMAAEAQTKAQSTVLSVDRVLEKEGKEKSNAWVDWLSACQYLEARKPPTSLDYQLEFFAYCTRVANLNQSLPNASAR